MTFIIIYYASTRYIYNTNNFKTCLLCLRHVPVIQNRGRRQRLQSFAAKHTDTVSTLLIFSPELERGRKIKGAGKGSLFTVLRNAVVVWDPSLWIHVYLHWDRIPGVFLASPPFHTSSCLSKEETLKTSQPPLKNNNKESLSTSQLSPPQITKVHQPSGLTRKDNSLWAVKQRTAHYPESLNDMNVLL